MYSIVKLDLIIKFLSNYGINYNSLSLDYQALVVILSNVLFLLFWFIVVYIMYRVVKKVF